MQTETISYTEGDDNFDAFIARPEGDGPKPAVLICHAWGGRSEFDENKAKQLAELGYIGAAIDVYGVGKRGHDIESNQALMMPLLEDPDLLQRRLGAAIKAVSALDGVDSAKVGAIGFCFGGLCSILMARMGAPLQGVVSFHGLLKIGKKLDDEVKAKILVLHGQDDPMVPPEDIGSFAEEMKRIHAQWSLHVYPGAKHAFTVQGSDNHDLGTVYNESADRQSWATMKRFLGGVLS